MNEPECANCKETRDLTDCNGFYLCDYCYDLMARDAYENQ